MLSLVTAAEQQYHHEVQRRDRNLALLASIRERRLAETATPEIVAPAPATRQPRAWARPIGVHLASAETCSTACAVA
jgi:hypothetical protein